MKQPVLDPGRSSWPAVAAAVGCVTEISPLVKPPVPQRASWGGGRSVLILLAGCVSASMVTVTVMIVVAIIASPR